MDSLLHGKAAIVTGAGRGIGRSIALALSAQGAAVGLIARSEEELETLAGEIRKQGGTAFVAAGDLSLTDRIEPAFRQLVDQLQGLDILVNNAGVFLERSLDELDLEAWEQTLRVNLTAPFVLTRLAVPEMRRRGGGRVVNIASTASLQGYLHQSAYCASKHGLLGFARSIAMELKKDNIHLHTVCPGGVDTGLIRGTFLASRLEGQPMIQPDDIASTVLHLITRPANIDLPELVIRRFDPGA